MKPSLGNPARGGQYFIRLSVIEEIYQNLNNHLYLSAPRRMGKTSTFHYLVENPKESFLFLYFNSEAIDSPTSFFEELLEEM